MAGRFPAAEGSGVLASENVAVFAGVHLDPLEFDVLLAEHGTSGEFRRAVMCPCTRLDTGTARVDCPHCRGRRYVYPEHLREPMIVLDAQRTATFRRTAVGELPSGTVHLTFPSHAIPAMGDLWLPDGEEHVVVERFVRDGTRRVTNAALSPQRGYVPDHVPVESSGEPRARLLYGAPCCLEAVTWELPTTGGLAFGTRGMDFDVDPDGTWTWAPGRGPAPGATWTVRYRAPAAYMVALDAAQHRTEGDAAMPRLVQAQRLDKVTPDDIRP